MINTQLSEQVQANRQSLKRPLILFLILAAFTIAVLFQQQMLPVLEGNDEPLHYNYVTWLRAYRQLPDRATFTTNTTRQETGQPPLVYWVGAVILDVLHRPVTAVDLLTSVTDSRNQWFTPPDFWNRRDNYNMFYHGPNERAFVDPDVVTNDRILRLISVVYGWLAILGVYGLAAEVFGGSGWAIIATAFFAFSPVFTYMSATFTNDAPATAFSSLALWQTMVLLRRGAATKRLILIGVLIALAGLSKVNALIIVPAVLLALYFDVHKHSRSVANKSIANKSVAYFVAQFTAKVAVLAVVGGLLFGPWMVYGYIANHDPVGLGTHKDEARDRQPKPTPIQVIQALPDVYYSYWAKFGTASIWLNPLAYLIFTGLVLLSLFGYFRYFKTYGIPLESLAWQQLAVCSLAFGVATLALLYWLITLFPIAFAITGRLIYFVHGAFAVILIKGLVLLTQRVSTHKGIALALRTYALGAVMGVSLILSPIVIWAAYKTPELLTREQLPALKGEPLDFKADDIGSTGAIRFLGYVPAPIAPLHEKDLYKVKLCWEVLKPATQDVAFSIKVFDSAGTTYAIRTSIHGLGHFNSSLWQTGDIFCDDVEVPVEKSLAPAQLYNVLLSVPNVRGTGVDWTAYSKDNKPIQYPFIYQLVSPAGDMTKTIAANQTIGPDQQWKSSDISFPKFVTLKGYSIDGDFKLGSTVKLNLLWEVQQSKPENWFQFIHLNGPNGVIPVVAGPPRNGNYPTWAWSNGERIIDTWQLNLPADLVPGSYKVQLGFFNAENNQRLPALQGTTDVPDRNPTLTIIEVK